MKKILFFILLYLLLIPNVFAEEKTVFSIDSKNSSPGKDITISVYMKNNPSYELVSFELPLDTNLVEFKKCVVNGFEDATMKSCEINPYNKIIFYAFTINTEEDSLLTQTGKLVDIHLKIKDKADKDIPLALKITGFGKDADKPIDYEVESGFIRIAGDIKTKKINEIEELGKEVGEQSVIWESSDEETAIVDPEGNVEFKGGGNATIVAKDVEGNVVYKKNYFVNTKEPKKEINESKIVIPIVLIFSLLLFFQIHKKRKLKS
jgi:hypothetical protein